MVPAAKPVNEAQRLKALRDLDVLDTPPEQAFDDLVGLAAQICQAPLAMVSLVDAERQWFKAETGLGVRETPIETSICAHVILEEDFVEIHDTLEDTRMQDNPLCCGDPGLRFYAGALLRTEDGKNVTDQQIRALGAWQPTAEPDTAHAHTHAACRRTVHASNPAHSTGIIRHTAAAAA